MGAGLWFLGWGMMQVLFSWLVVGELDAREELVGIAQLTLVIPTVAFLLIGGAVADRIDRRRLLVALHLAAGTLAAALAATVGAGMLSFSLVIAYALAMGTIAAFCFPARDALLSEVAGENVMRAVTGITLIQFTGMGVGQLLAGSARYIGSPAAMTLQGAFFAVGALAFLAIPRRFARRAPRTDPVRPSDLFGGLLEVLRSPTLRPILFMAVAVGLFFNGPYFVGFPLLNREYYGGDVGNLSLLFMTFPLGSVLGLSLLWRRGRVRRRGRALALAQSTGALCLIAISTGIPFWGTLVAGTTWGLCGAFFLGLGQTVFQETASDANRARVLSTYRLGMMGAGTLGLPTVGLLAAQLGALGTFAFCGAATLVFIALVCRLTGLWALESTRSGPSG
jgi:MFS family permease